VSAVLKSADPGRSADFVRLMELTRELKANFERSEWERSAEVESERRALIERIFDQRPTVDELPLLTMALREVVRLNDELVGLAEHRRRALARDLDLVSASQQASRSYAAVAADSQRP
jgi:translation initiation factor 2B subunit (eIF-2B alpha/beta/delta family)